MAKKKKSRRPRTDGSVAWDQVDDFDIKRSTGAGLNDTVEILRDLAEAEERVIESSRGMRSSLGEFYDSLGEDTKKGITEEVIKLTEALGDLGTEFMKSDKGQELFGGLSEGATIFGSTATSIVGSVAAGFAAGGPIGAAIGGLTGVVKVLGDEWQESNRRIQESNAELAKAEAEHVDRMAQRKRDAVSGEIERVYQEELEKIEQQNAALDHQRELRGALGGRDRALFELKQSQDRSQGKNETLLKSEKIAFHLSERQRAVEEEIRAAEEKTSFLRQKRDEKLVQREDIRSQGLGTDNQEYQKADSELDDFERKYAAAQEEERALKNASVPRRVQNEYQAEREATDLDRETREEIEREAGRLRGELQQRKKSGNLSKAASGSLAELDSVLKDGKVGRGEVDRVKAAIDGLKNSREASDRAVIEGMREISSLSESYTRSIEQLVTGLNKQRDEIRRIAARLNKNSDGK